jgi:hypothetical protein
LLLAALSAVLPSACSLSLPCSTSRHLLGHTQSPDPVLLRTIEKLKPNGMRRRSPFRSRELTGCGRLSVHSSSVAPISIPSDDDCSPMRSSFFSKAKRFFQNQSLIILKNQKQKLLSSAAMFGILLLLSPKRALASTTSLFPGPKTIPSLRTIIKIALIPWVLVSFYSQIKVKRRQAKDATSEWNRFAQYPAARGRAIFTSILLPQAFWIILSKVLWFRADKIRQRAGKAFAQALLQLGPLYIKLGQILSCQKNLLGEEWITAMERLQDQVPARTSQAALDLAYTTVKGGKEEFESIFETFDTTPLAAASLGQVHKATLRRKPGENPDNPPEVVAVKVQRPYLRKIYDQDFQFLTNIAKFMDKMPSKGRDVGGIQNSWTTIFEDAEDILYREIDYRDEAKNGVRFCQDFGLTKGGKPVPPTAKSKNNETLPSAAEWLRVPYVYDELCNERLLVMEFVPSIKITNDEKLAAANVTELDKIDLADSLARAYLRQFCCNLFFCKWLWSCYRGLAFFWACNSHLFFCFCKQYSCSYGPPSRQCWL